MKIYTKTGDKGQTSLVYGVRVYKNDARVEAYGTCDEANSMIGLAFSYLVGQDFPEILEIKEIFHRIQTALFHVGAEIATPKGKQVNWTLSPSDINGLEQYIDKWDAHLSALKNFILPGGHPAAATLHVARTIVRRAERNAITVEDINPLVLAYLNRLSDFLFVAARYVNYLLGFEESNLHGNL